VEKKEKRDTSADPKTILLEGQGPKKETKRRQKRVKKIAGGGWARMRVRYKKPLMIFTTKNRCEKISETKRKMGGELGGELGWEKKITGERGESLLPN